MNKVYVFGTRGIPNLLGGVESHSEELYPRIVSLSNYEVVVLARSCYVDLSQSDIFKGVKLKAIYAPRVRSLEAIVHSLLCVLYCAIKRPTVVHIHAIGPCVVVPLARLFGLKVVITHHGPDYERQKWGKLAKWFLKFGERVGVKYANKVIVISLGIYKSIVEKFNRNDAFVIPNGVTYSNTEFDNGPLLKYNVKKFGYVFTLGRFVPEKGFDYLINAFNKANLDSEIKLVIAGDADHPSEYSRDLKRLAADSGVILTGFIKGNELQQLFSNSKLFVLPSFYEGLPISLLEAMNYELPILASDIPANKQVGLPDGSYFQVGNEDELCVKLDEFLTSSKDTKIKYDLEKYNWDVIALNTINVYTSI